MQLTFKTLLLQAAIVAVALCVGATAMYAWQARGNKVDQPAVAKGGMSSFIRELHDNAHMDNLPVQVIENYN
jgi:hypothetical protein